MFKNEKLNYVGFSKYKNYDFIQDIFPLANLL